MEWKTAPNELLWPVDSRQFIVETRRKPESLIDASIIPRIEKLGTASACRERQ